MVISKINSASNKLHKAIVSVGTNINPQSNLNKAREILASELEFLDEATVIQTKPDGYQNQADFLNGAYLLATDMSYDDFNRYLKAVERRMGRVKGPIKSGPRCIDLDIIVWDAQVVHEDYNQNKHYVVRPVNQLLQANDIELCRHS